jgi:hypothetical protein
MFNRHIIVVAMAGLLGGAILGAFIVTGTEVAHRRQRVQFTIYGITRLVLLNLLICAAFTTVCITILAAGHAYPLSHLDGYVLSGCFLVGALIAKSCRYLYWKPSKW